ncbi:MAG TPA: VWA domain-containing protein [Chloroflexia bacterium]|nr:VWA domain-containing protein [Chloroflexia bacterium]
MTFLWPGFLALLAFVPLLAAVYIWFLRRRRVALRYSSLALVRAAMPRYSRLRRHLPFVAFLIALSSLSVAVARPVRIVSVPSGQATIILTIDASASMRQRDIPPSRLEAAQAAALSFIGRQKSSTQIGIVAFAGYAELIQPPTANQEALQVAVESLTLARGTAIGSGILKSIDAIAAIDPSIAPSVIGEPRPDAPPAVPKGAFAPHIIVVLTDGVSTTGPDALGAAQQAADRGIRVYTIGFGTENGSGQFGGGDPFGRGNQQFGGGGPQGGFRRGIDEETLKQIANLTDGTYYTASSSGELVKVFENLPTHLITKHAVMEISVAFAAAGALLVAVAMGLALLWSPVP